MVNSSQLAEMVRELVLEVEDEVLARRRDFHAHPELSYQEFRTARIIADELRDLGLDVRERVGGTGVVGRLIGSRPGRVVALRADIDALPLQEESQFPYASQNPGVMHACGHDGHAAMLLGVARVLARLRDTVAGEVRLIFQPAEETCGGAQAMLADGAYADPPPQATFGLHLWNDLPAGTVGLRDGPLFAASDDFTLVVRGTGGHAAMPHQAVDPIVVAAELVLALQTAVAREVSPLEPALLTIASIHGGTAANIIPATVQLKGTVRAFSDPVQTQLQRRLEEIARGLTEAARAGFELDYRRYSPAVVNDPEKTRLVRGVAARVVGDSQIVRPEQTLGGDDISHFLRAAPGAYILVGSGTPGAKSAPHHHPRFDIDESSLSVGVHLLAATALEFLDQL